MSDTTADIPQNGPAPVIPTTTAAPPVPPVAPPDLLPPPDMPVPAPPEPPAALPNTDLERARKFFEWMEGDARYIVVWKQWVVWNEDKGWLLDASGLANHAIKRSAAQFADDMMEHAGHFPEGAQRIAAEAIARKLFGNETQNTMIAQLQTFEDLQAAPMDFDSDKMLLGVQNGVVDLRTGVFRIDQKEDMITKRCAVEYDSDAQCPMWKEFLGQVQPDPEVRGFLQRVMGYALTGCINEQVMFFFYGKGKNGKSTFFDVLQPIFGDYNWKADSNLFLDSGRNESKSNAMANLPEKRFVVGSEISEQSRLAEHVIKNLTGDDLINARRLYCEEFNFHGTHKLFLFGNYKPIVSGTDEGIWRRLKFVPWNTFIPEEKRDRGIVPRLASEAAGILNWMIEGCREWQKTGLATPAVIDEAVDEYREDEDLLEQFIKAQCKMEGEIERGIFASNVKLWMESQGYKWSLSPHAIGGRIAKIDGITKRESNGKRFWVGLSMKDPKAFIHR